MNLEVILKVLDRVKGCTFATIDSTTYPQKGIEKITKGERVLLFTNQNVSGYNEMVKRRLLEAGKDPRGFSLGDLPWGERLPGTPLIMHNGRYYLQTVRIDKGKSEYYLKSLAGRRKIDPEAYGFRKRRTNQGLASADQVEVSTFNLEHIDRIALMGETLVATSDSVLPVGA